MEIKFVTTRLNHTTQEWENEVIHKEYLHQCLMKLK